MIAHRGIARYSFILMSVFLLLFFPVVVGLGCLFCFMGVLGGGVGRMRLSMLKGGYVWISFFFFFF